SSTGTPSVFLHPAEAVHGDVGMLTSGDVVLALSNSGETEELVKLVGTIKRLGLSLISMVGDTDSTLAKSADLVLDVGVDQEACPLGLAPTASTTASMALGDALALSLSEKRGFHMEDFARLHPGGRLGKKLAKVGELMHRGEKIPKVSGEAGMDAVIYEMSKKGLGITSVVQDDDPLLGVYTDGDLRRTLDNDIDIHSAKISDVMTKQCKTQSDNVLAAEALNFMQQHSINDLLIVDDNNKLIGALNMQDMLRAGVI
ncbi:MAG: KpsF/GutQ family sugar-phosphate isomerase, partial [Gammaproteobacteria bacterium]|nr:KpsF/GutQ family sugar-phosphate isomerase [Gammaproteobacteria bacterium]